MREGVRYFYKGGTLTKICKTVSEGTELIREDYYRYQTSYGSFEYVNSFVGSELLLKNEYVEIFEEELSNTIESLEHLKELIG